ncbi:MAG TPA: L,D-transpeptidase family protein [Xanthobacteraceae bacterium]|nr:L,D-transpeptidase family protein [Xanthobacteraceae bacterium]
MAYRRRAAQAVCALAVTGIAGVAWGISSADAQYYYSPRGGHYYGGPPPGYFGGPPPGFIEPPRRSRFHGGAGDPLKQKTAEQLKKAPPLAEVKGQLLIAISISKQRLTVYDDGVAIAHSPVSTGTATHPTPTGVFSIIQKNRFHRSNIYSGAPMPFMQRITWSGVALHAGVLPGYPASHGCIRLPNDFAVRLFATTKMGARVVVSQEELRPTDIAHAHLFKPKAKPAPEPAPVAAAPVAKPEEKPTAVAVAPEPKPVAPVEIVKADTKIEAVKPAEDKPLVANAEAEKAEEKSSEPARTDEAAPAESVAAVKEEAEKADPAKPELPELKLIKSEEPKAEIAKAETAKIEPAKAEPVKTEPLKAEVASAPPPAVNVTVTDLRPTVAPAPAAPRPTFERALRPGPVSVFVSRKERRVYVRKQFEPIFEMPAEILNPDQPIGTHVFTAMQIGDGTARWTAVSMPADYPRPPRTRRIAEVQQPVQHKGRAKTVDVAAAPVVPAVSAKEALDRIVLPTQAIDRISEMLSAGATLVISDQGLGGETGLETDFIVVTREQPPEHFAELNARSSPRKRVRRNSAEFLFGR